MLYQVQAERKRRKLTQTDMGRVIGKSMGTYRKKEVGELEFSDEEKIKILNYFDLPMERVLIFFER